MFDRIRTAVLLCTVATIAVLLAGVLSSCGSSDSGATPSASTAETASSGAATAAGDKAPSPAGEPIKIGTICACTGPIASSLGAIPQVVKAWQAAVNADGGINGHPVQVVLKDDQADPQKALVAARELVQQDKVIALAGSYSPTATVYSPYFIKNNVPQVGGPPESLAIEDSPTFYPSGGNFAGQFYGLVKRAKDDGFSKLSVFFCAEYAGCASQGKAYTTIADTIGGIKVVHQGPISASAPNYDAQCIAAKQAGTDSMYIADTEPPIQRMLQDCQQQGLEAQQYQTVANVTPKLAADPNAKNMAITYNNVPASDTSTPGGKYLNEALDKYAPGIKDNPAWNETLSSVWAGLQLFRKAAELGKVGPTSSADDLLGGLYQIKDETLDGLSPPLTFVKGKGTPVNCWFIGLTKDGKVTAPSTQPACIPADEAEIVTNAVLGK